VAARVIVHGAGSPSSFPSSSGSRELFGVIDARAGIEQVSLKPMR
jgi:hypothetical protein